MPGPKGDVGETGWFGGYFDEKVQGKLGDTGFPGRPGPKGRIGDSGINGQAGTQGSPGNVGPPGPNGFPGPLGVAGNPGMRGRVGLMGQQGMQGPLGFQGPTGPNPRFASITSIHSQTTEVPKCPDGTTEMFNGYSMFKLEGNLRSERQNLGAAGSCLRQFNVNPFLFCNFNGKCQHAGRNERSYWLTTIDTDPLKMPQPVKGQEILKVGISILD